MNEKYYNLLRYLLTAARKNLAKDLEKKYFGYNARMEDWHWGICSNGKTNGICPQYIEWGTVHWLTFLYPQYADNTQLDILIPGHPSDSVDVLSRISVAMDGAVWVLLNPHKTEWLWIFGLSCGKMSPFKTDEQTEGLLGLTALAGWASGSDGQQELCT